MEKLLNKLNAIVRRGKSYQKIYDKLYNVLEKYNKKSEKHYFLQTEYGFWINSEIVEETEFFIFSAEGKEAKIGSMYEVDGKVTSYKNASDAFSLEVWGYKREY